MPSGNLIARLFVQTAVTLAVMAALLFVPAGTWRWPQAWWLLAIFLLGTAYFGAFLLRRDPALLESRLGGPVQKDQPLWDRLFLGAVMIGWCAWLAFMAWDARARHGAPMPGWLEILGGVLIAGGFLGIMPVFAANSFAAPTVRVQSEQRVIDTGPYAHVRHPMYATALLYLIGMPLLLGSWWGLIGTAIIALAISWRAVGEENTLARELPGYADYMKRVRWRLVPGVW
ncbi:MAG: methyltransferase family protein [Rhizomicrobium sp.]